MLYYRRCVQGEEAGEESRDVLLARRGPAKRARGGQGRENRVEWRSAVLVLRESGVW
jgi:hypothetical protein